MEQAVHSRRPEAAIERVDVSAYRVPTDFPESDGTFEWQATTIVLVEIHAGARVGLGYTYAGSSITKMIQEHLVPRVLKHDALAVPALWIDMVKSVRNLGRPGLCSMAIAAVDAALWDLKAKILDLPLVTMLGAARPGIGVYGSGGFTSYSEAQLQKQLGNWVEQGIPRVKMKIGRQPDSDLDRVRAARSAIGHAPQLFVDANGAYERKQAMAFARAFADMNVTWFEEPVSSDDLNGLRLVRQSAPAGMDVTAGEYGYDLFYFRRMLEAEAVDVIQPDATRCGGISGFLQAAQISDAFLTPCSAHTAPSIHLHPCCAIPRVRPLEYFHDHVRIEQMFFEGTVRPKRGVLNPDLAKPGLGLDFKRADAEKYAIH
jgi:L-alanine-DL-glutamate epimerase-like enolase superfamily enzyme